MKIRTATGLIAWYMQSCKFDGWTSFWNTIYVLPGHERCRLEQIERDGRSSS